MRMTSEFFALSFNTISKKIANCQNRLIWWQMERLLEQLNIAVVGWFLVLLVIELNLSKPLLGVGCRNRSAAVILVSENIASLATLFSNDGEALTAEKAFDYGLAYRIRIWKTDKTVEQLLKIKKRSFQILCAERKRFGKHSLKVMGPICGSWIDLQKKLAFMRRFQGRVIAYSEKRRSLKGK